MVSGLKLVIGNKNYSSWSLRSWLLLAHFGIDFEEIRIALDLPETPRRLRELSPSCKVPVLLHNDLTIWDSLAINEYVNERLLEGAGWPGAWEARAHARAVACEMHSGFSDLRNRWPMNVRLQRKLPVDASLHKDISRIEQIWQQCLEQYGGPWLFGQFSIADAMFAPVVMRFHAYQPALGEHSAAYVATMLAHPQLQAWISAGKAEVEVIREDEVGYLLGEAGWE